MKELLIIAIGSAFVNNVVLSQFLGICPFLGVSKKVEVRDAFLVFIIFLFVPCSKETLEVYPVLFLHIEYFYSDIGNSSV